MADNRIVHHHGASPSRPSKKARLVAGPLDREAQSPEIGDDDVSTDMRPRKRPSTYRTSHQPEKKAMRAKRQHTKNPADTAKCIREGFYAQGDSFRAETQLSLTAAYIQLPDHEAVMHYLGSPAMMVAFEIFAKHHERLESVVTKKLFDKLEHNQATNEFEKLCPPSVKDPFKALVEGAKTLMLETSPAKAMAYLAWWVTTIPTEWYTLPDNEKEKLYDLSRAQIMDDWLTWPILSGSTTLASTCRPKWTHPKDECRNAELCNRAMATFKGLYRHIMHGSWVGKPKKQDNAPFSDRHNSLWRDYYAQTPIDFTETRHVPAWMRPDSPDAHQETGERSDASDHPQTLVPTAGVSDHPQSPYEPLAPSNDHQKLGVRATSSAQPTLLQEIVQPSSTPQKNIVFEWMGMEDNERLVDSQHSPGWQKHIHSIMTEILYEPTPLGLIPDEYDDPKQYRDYVRRHIGLASIPAKVRPSSQKQDDFHVTLAQLCVASEDGEELLAWSESDDKSVMPWTELCQYLTTHSEPKLRWALSVHDWSDWRCFNECCDGIVSESEET